ncbi:MAG: ketol-acid reductoisomerase [Planctomycetes bacterium]|nr:ketol-acid reductoisomerase [Planctomycetota bacterium]
MLRSFDSRDARVSDIQDLRIAVLGYGSQGSAHALNLRDAGCKVVVGQRPGGARFQQARDDGFVPCGLAEAAGPADLIIFALPDDRMGTIFRSELAPALRPGQTLGFIHGFAIHYQQITPPHDVDVVLVAPKAQGAGVRSLYVAGRGPAALVAVGQDATGRALRTALGWAAGIGAARAGILETTFRDETETDLFGEQAVLCGGITALIKSAFETLVEAGYPPELAYFECCHELKLLADLIHAGGITYMRERISSTARYGDLTRGPRLVDDAVRSRMRAMLEEIRSGSFAREFLDDAAAGAAKSRALMQRDAAHPIEATGAAMRRLALGSEQPER